MECALDSLYIYLHLVRLYTTWFVCVHSVHLCVTFDGEEEKAGWLLIARPRKLCMALLDTSLNEIHTRDSTLRSILTQHIHHRLIER